MACSNDDRFNADRAIAVNGDGASDQVSLLEGLAEPDLPAASASCAVQCNPRTTRRLLACIMIAIL